MDYIAITGKILRKRRESCIIRPLYTPPKAWGHATVAQLVEQTIRNRQVKGPTPFGGSLDTRMMF